MLQLCGQHAELVAQHLLPIADAGDLQPDAGKHLLRHLQTQRVVIGQQDVLALVLRQQLWPRFGGRAVNAPACRLTKSPVACITSQINQLLVNLLVNAAQAIDSKGLNTVRSGEQADEVWLEVSDTTFRITLPQTQPQLTRAATA